MTHDQWQLLLDIVGGKKVANPIGFIIDSPWLPGWFGCDSITYYSSDEVWFDANLRAIKTFPDVVFLPGFWSEYGEINEPSAFGCPLTWEPANLPHAHKIIFSNDDIASLKKPNVKTAGLLPLMLNRLKMMRPRIEAEGHEIKFSVARGPLNIATFLMGTSEFFTAMMMRPDDTHKLLQLITDFTIDWLQLQKETIPTIDGIMILDDLVGFVGEPQCSEFVVPYLKKIYNAFDAKINFFHNDADGLVVGAHLQDIGVNLFNFSFKHSINEMREACGDHLALLGNIPPRDVLAVGDAETVKRVVQETMQMTADKRRVMWSCGGGVPQGVSTENMQAFIEAVQNCKPGETT